MIPKFRSGVFYMPVDNGILFRSRDGSKKILGKGLYNLFERLLPLLNGEYSLDNILEMIPNEGTRQVVHQFFYELLSCKVIYDRSKSRPHDLTDEEISTYTETIQYIDEFHQDAEYAFMQFRQKVYWVQGSSELAQSVVDFLKRLGAKNVTLSSEPPEDLSTVGICIAIAHSQAIWEKFMQHEILYRQYKWEYFPVITFPHQIWMGPFAYDENPHYHCHTLHELVGKEEAFGDQLPSYSHVVCSAAAAQVTLEVLNHVTKAFGIRTNDQVIVLDIHTLMTKLYQLDCGSDCRQGEDRIWEDPQFRLKRWLMLQEMVTTQEEVMVQEEVLIKPLRDLHFEIGARDLPQSPLMLSMAKHAEHVVIGTGETVLMANHLAMPWLRMIVLEEQMLPTAVYYSLQENRWLQGAILAKTAAFGSSIDQILFHAVLRLTEEYGPSVWPGVTVTEWKEAIFTELSPYGEYVLDRAKVAGLIKVRVCEIPRMGLSIAEAIHEKNTFIGIAALEANAIEIALERLIVFEQTNGQYSHYVVSSYERAIRATTPVQLHSYLNELVENGVHLGMIPIDQKLPMQKEIICSIVLLQAE